jgi:hypothetical protein
MEIFPISIHVPQVETKNSFTQPIVAEKKKYPERAEAAPYIKRNGKSFGTGGARGDHDSPS